jgi:universal stress protein A
MALIKSILFPVDFSYSCVAMAAYVERAAALFGAKVSLVHVVDPSMNNGFELYDRPPVEAQEQQLSAGREKLDLFLSAMFPASGFPRIVASGDAASEIVQLARNDRFDLIIMPTHAGIFRQLLLGSTTAKVINGADCPVLTSKHAEVIAPRPLDHRDWLCAIGLSVDSERVLRFARAAAAETHSKLTIIHAVQIGDNGLPIDLDVDEQVLPAEREQARRRIAQLQQTVGLNVPVRITVGSVKDALLEAARQLDADGIIIGRSHHPGASGRLSDLASTVARDSPIAVLSV